MEENRFYFIKDEFYKRFQNCGLMANNPTDETGKHGRPCFYAKRIENIIWLIPISSKIEKYTRIYDEKISRYKKNYDGIIFGYVNGKKRAFLVQNIFPVTENYIDEMYMLNNSTIPATVNKKISEALKKSAEKVVRLNKQGIKISITNINKILEGLKNECSN